MACAEQLEILEQKEKADELMFFAKISGVPMESTTEGEEDTGSIGFVEKWRNKGAEVW